MKKVYKYLIALGIGFALAFWLVYSKGIFNQTETAIILQILADGFTLPAVLYLGIGGLIFVSNEGAFDFLTYGMTSFLDLFRKEKKNQFTSFYDYAESKKGERLGFGVMLICGIIFSALTAIVLVIYSNLVY